MIKNQILTLVDGYSKRERLDHVIKVKPGSQNSS